jgi:hypothetical protein
MPICFSRIRGCGLGAPIAGGRTDPAGFLNRPSEPFFGSALCAGASRGNLPNAQNLCRFPDDCVMDEPNEPGAPESYPLLPMAAE